MPSSSPATPLERARPLLGTIVRIEAVFADAKYASAAIDAAFSEVALVHRLMSFHDADSDLARINAAAPREAIDIDARTAEVLRAALDHAAQSDGAFDPTIGALAVAAGMLPKPSGAHEPDPRASWRDVQLDGHCVRVNKKAWLDFGGIAKGYAVDRAIAVLEEYGATRACVEAGGDLRVIGRDHAVRLRADDSHSLPLLLIDDGAVASSGGDARAEARHFEAAGKGALDRAAFACVTAPSCMTADALTKIVLARGIDATESLLHHYGAEACTHDPVAGWRTSKGFA